MKRTRFAMLGFCLGYAALVASAQTRTNGPDVIVGDLLDINKWGTIGNTTSYSIGTTSCNIGSATIAWVSSTNRHPVIAQNMYRLKNGRFEMIGQGWLKHGFTALTQSLCHSCSGQGGSVLGVGCSDPYSAGLNGSQGNLGPKFEVNAWTGVFAFPHFARSQTGDAIYKRIQVSNDDFNPSLNPGAIYFAEGQYITQDDAQFFGQADGGSNGNNNASYERLSVGALSGGGYIVSATGPTFRLLPAIMAWPANDPGAQVRIVQVPSEGRFYLGWKTTDLGGGRWHYEYALYNLNSHRGANSFSVPNRGGTLSNIEFRDIAYHSGERQVGTDWTNSTAGNAITWSTETWTTANDLTANALRWSTLYNFRFDSTRPPTNGNVTIGLFRPGTLGNLVVSGVSVPTPVPVGPLGDTNCDGVVNFDDITPFTLAIIDQAAYLAQYPACDPLTADVNQDGVVNFDDINGFVACVVAGGC